MKKKLHSIFNLILAITLAQSVIAQTNVSGGIYANTTWTQANSPYIVTDTIVVFPGVTLTIQPGVVVKFADYKRIELRQARLIALGTSTDSIIFTSNNPSPWAGIYSGIYLNGGHVSSRLSYCDVSYANIGIYATILDSLIIHHCRFSKNLDGLEFVATNTSEVGVIDSSLFSNNSNGTALYLEYLSSAKVYGCSFLSNGTGFSGAHGPPNTSVFHYFMNDCVFRSNQIGISPGKMRVTNCIINGNASGVSGMGKSTIANCQLDSNTVVGINTYADSVINCNLRYNTVGIITFESVVTGNVIEHSTGANITDNGSSLSTITNNVIQYGNVGINAFTSGVLLITKNIINYNATGIKLNNTNCTISCNRICNNTSYDLNYSHANNVNVKNNYWCTPDSASTEPLIYDGYDNVSNGLALILPFDSICAPVMGIMENLAPNSFSIYPNPGSGTFTVDGTQKISAIEIADMLGQVVYNEKTNNTKAELQIDKPGIYFVIIRTATGTITKKIIIN